MINQEDNIQAASAELSDKLLSQLFHLKQYERPEGSRMTRNKQNIMRRIRVESHAKRKSVGDLIEVSFPWFFAEPKYGVALLFAAFAGLQYLGVNARHAAQSDTGIYTTSTERFAAYQQVAAASSNRVEYPSLPVGTRLFPAWHDSDTLKPVANPSPDWRE